MSQGSGDDVVVIGPGAIGSAFGAALVQAGRRVTFVARQPFERLEVTYPGGQVSAGPEDGTRVVTDAHIALGPVGPAALVLLATKSHQTDGASAALRAATGPDTVVAVLQNGVEHRATVEPILDGVGRVLPTMVACPAQRDEPGRVRVTGRALLEVPAGPDAERLQQAFDGSFAVIRPVEDWVTSTWTKVVINAASGAVGVLARRDNSVYADPEAQQCAMALMYEVAAVARAEGANIPDELVPMIMAGVVERAGNHLNSITADRLAGRPTEWQARNEVVVRTAARHGIDVPLNRFVTTLIRLGEPAATAGT